VSSKRLVTYLVLDLAVWGLVGYLLITESEVTRARFWYHSTLANRRIAAVFGTLGLFSEARYDAAVQGLR
jgi:hypothetical protein